MAGTNRGQLIASSGVALAGGRVIPRAALRVVGFCMLTALFAQIRIPLPGTPVPMTLQLLGVLLAGLCLSPVAAIAAMTLYLGAGTVWTPLFAPGSAGVAGVTGGYLMGFVLAAGVVSLVRGRSVQLGRLILAGALGTALVFGMGIVWQVTRFEFTFWRALQLGVLPFLPKAVIQLGLAVAAVRAAGSMGRARTVKGTTDGITY